MTAVAGSSNKVGGKKTLIVVLRPLERSVQLRAAIVHSGAVALAATKKIQNRKIRARDWNDTHRTHEQHRSAAVAVLIAVMGTRGCSTSVQRLPRANDSCRRAFLLRELRTRSWSFSFGWYRDVMQLDASTPSAMHPEGPEPRHELTVVYRQECPEIVRHSIKSRHIGAVITVAD